MDSSMHATIWVAGQTLPFPFFYNSHPHFPRNLPTHTTSPCAPFCLHRAPTTYHPHRPYLPPPGMLYPTPNSPAAVAPPTLTPLSPPNSLPLPSSCDPSRQRYHSPYVQNMDEAALGVRILLHVHVRSLNVRDSYYHHCYTNERGWFNVNRSDANICDIYTSTAYRALVACRTCLPPHCAP